MRIEAKSAPSKILARAQRSSRDRSQKRIKRGAAMILPPASPNHQVSQTPAKCVHGTNPPSARLVTPKVGLMRVAVKPANTTYLRTSSARSKARIPWAREFVSNAAASASNVLPAATPREVATGNTLEALAAALLTN